MTDKLTHLLTLFTDLGALTQRVNEELLSALRQLNRGRGFGEADRRAALDTMDKLFNERTGPVDRRVTNYVFGTTQHRRRVNYPRGRREGDAERAVARNHEPGLIGRRISGIVDRRVRDDPNNSPHPRRSGLSRRAGDAERSCKRWEVYCASKADLR